ncbi:MAG: creatininase family protein [Ruminococcaceae bacterium]|nr:creatininase family protein [Oscillospiraceae bacterium]
MEMFKMTVDEICSLDPELAIIPVGSIEQHGPHLPIMTDWAIATELGKRISEKMGAFLLPALPISTCREHMGKKGSVWMEPTTFYQMMHDIVMSLKAQGFKRVGILTTHGGIFVTTPLVRDLNAKFQPDLQVALVTYDSFKIEGIMESQGLHADETETSEILAIAPETVHMDKAADFVPDVPRSYLNYGSIFRASPTGVWGEPTKATAQKGERFLEEFSNMAVEEFNKAFDYMTNKEKFGYSNF